jgi:uncharacterized protein YjbI with pentapeptide repeats
LETLAELGENKVRRNRLTLLVTNVGCWGLMFLIASILIAVFGFMENNRGSISFHKLVSEFYSNGSVALATIAVTVLLIDSINGRHSKQQEIRSLVADARSGIDDFKRRGLLELHERHLFYDGSLQAHDLAGIDLSDQYMIDDFLHHLHIHLGGSDRKAKLKRADLSVANLARAHFHDANFEGAILWRASMDQAFLRKANLRKANLNRANIQRAQLQGGDLRNANLWYAYLSEADLSDANLEGANLSGATLGSNGILISYGEDKETFRLEPTKFNENTVLPDGSKWSQDVDMDRFTQRSHPDFWRPQTSVFRRKPWWYKHENDDRPHDH